MHGERLYIPALQFLQFIPEFFTVEAIMRGHGEMCFVPLFQTAQIIQLKEPPRRIEVIHGNRNAYNPDAESQELCLELRIGRPYLGECALVKQDIDPAHFLLIVIIAKGWILPKQFSQIQYPLPQLREYRRSLLIAALYHHREQEGWCTASLYQLRQVFFGNVQNGHRHESRRELLLLIKDLVIPDIHCELREIVVLLYSQRHSIALLSHIRFTAVLRYSHSIKKYRIIK